MKTIEGKKAILEQVPDLLYDESRAGGGVPAAVFFPETEEDVRFVVRKAAESGTPVVPAGAQTGITAGSTPPDGCYLLSFSAMNRVTGVTEQEDGKIILTCLPGITLEDIDHLLLSGGEEYPDLPGRDILNEQSLTYFPDPTEMSAALGGTIATNASGARTFAYGPTRNHIETLSLVLASGETCTLKRGQVMAHNGAFTLVTDQGSSFTIPASDYTWPWPKNASGYFSAPGMDLVDLFIGSEGTLGIITAAGLILHSRPDILSGVSFFPGRREAFGFASFLRKEDRVISIEYFDGTALDLLRTYGKDISLKLPEFPAVAGAAVFWEYHESGDASLEDRLERWDEVLGEHSSSLDLTWSGFDPGEKERLKTFRHAVPEIINSRVADAKKTYPGVRKVSTDAAVQEERFGTLIDDFFNTLESSGLEFGVFGHLGDFHLHFNLIPKNDREMAAAVTLYGELMDMVISCKGTVSAEHGIGRIKTKYLEKMYPAEVIEKMREIKSALDPRWILNTGTLLTRE